MKKIIISIAVLTTSITAKSQINNIDSTNRFVIQSTVDVIQSIFKESFSTNFGKITLNIIYKNGVYEISEIRGVYTNYTSSYKIGNYNASVMGVLSFSSKEDLINALKTGINIINQETPMPGQEYRANIDGKELLRKSTSGKCFWMNSSLVFTKNITNKALNTLENI